MTTFKAIPDNEPWLSRSPMVQAFQKTCSFLDQHQSIGLSSANAFDPAFVRWALKEIKWSEGSTARTLLRDYPSVNEHQFHELRVWHKSLVDLGLGVHCNQTFVLTPSGRFLRDHPGNILKALAPHFLFECRWGGVRRSDAPFNFRNWARFMPLLDDLAEQGITSLSDVCNMLFAEAGLGKSDLRAELDFSVRVLEPLFWVGLLEATCVERADLSQHIIYRKTPLWNASVQLAPQARAVSLDRV